MNDPTGLRTRLDVEERCVLGTEEPLLKMPTGDIGALGSQEFGEVAPKHLLCFVFEHAKCGRVQRCEAAFEIQRVYDVAGGCDQRPEIRLERGAAHFGAAYLRSHARFTSHDPPSAH